MLYKLPLQGFDQIQSLFCTNTQVNSDSSSFEKRDSTNLSGYTQMGQVIHLMIYGVSFIVTSCA